MYEALGVYLSHDRIFRKLAGIKAKQAEADNLRKEEAETAAEAVRVEREGSRNELSSKQDELAAQFSKAEQTVTEANQAVSEADAFVAEQGDNLDPEVASEIAVMKAEAAEATGRFEQLKTELDSVAAEIKNFEESEEKGVEQNQEVSAEATLAPEEGGAPTEVLPEAAELELSLEEKLEQLRNSIVEEKQKLASINSGINTLRSNVRRIEELKEESLAHLQEIVAVSPQTGYVILVNESRDFQSKLDSLQEKMETKAEQYRVSNPNLRWDWIDGMTNEDRDVQGMIKERGELKENWKSSVPSAFLNVNGSTHIYDSRFKPDGEVAIIGNQDFSPLHERRIINQEGEMSLGEAIKKTEDYLANTIESDREEFSKTEETIAELEAEITKVASSVN